NRGRHGCHGRPHFTVKVAGHRADSGQTERGVTRVQGAVSPVAYVCDHPEKTSIAPVTTSRHDTPVLRIRTLNGRGLPAVKVVMKWTIGTDKPHSSMDRNVNVPLASTITSRIHELVANISIKALRTTRYSRGC